MCRLVRALYGHPESGAHWERHLEAAVKKIGGEKVPDHPSSFWFNRAKLLMTVYVDDILLAGPKGSHDQVWSSLRKEGIKIEDPENLSRFLGRTHVTSVGK